MTVDEPWVALDSTRLDQEVVGRAAASQASMRECMEEFRSHPLPLVDGPSVHMQHPRPEQTDHGRLSTWSPRDPGGVIGLLDRYRSGTADPVDVVTECLQRIDQPAAVNAVVARCDHEALRAARVSAERWRRGEPRALEGVPFCVKDNIAVAGLPTTAGSERLAGWIPTETAPVVTRLLDAGAILIGKSALPEWAFGDARPRHAVDNPWAPGHWTGGSSAGSAVALATRIVPLALGTDTGGSIRVPAAYCGVTGLKPTSGLLTCEGVIDCAWTLDHVGPMARSAADAAVALAIMSGERSADDAPSPPPQEIGVDALVGLRIGVVRGWFDEGSRPEVLAGRDEVVRRLVGLGAVCTDVVMPSAQLATTAAWVITVCEFAALHHDAVDPPAGYTASALERLMTGSAISAADYIRALRIRNELRASSVRLFEEVDVLITPGTPTIAPQLFPDLDPIFLDGDRMWMRDVSRHFIGFNLLGLPAVVVPAAHVGDPLRPVSVQFVGRPFDERTPLAVASAWQAVSEAHLLAPSDPDRQAPPPRSGLA